MGAIAIVRQLHTQRWARVFTWVTRVLLALGFLPSGLTKLLGNKFTRLGLDNPVGFFFEALYRTGWWYQFIGAAQVGAAALLLIPRTRTVGAIAYFVIILNICIITWSMHFTGTPVITTAMLLGSIWLLCWDLERLHGLVAEES